MILFRSNAAHPAGRPWTNRSLKKIPDTLCLGEALRAGNTPEYNNLQERTPIQILVALEKFQIANTSSGTPVHRLNARIPVKVR